MAENEGKTSTSSSKTDDPSEPKVASNLATEPEAKGKRSPGKPAKGHSASARHEEEDDDDGDDTDDEDEEDDDEGDEGDDEEEEEEEEVKAPPPKRAPPSKQKGKAPVVAQKKGKGSVYRKAPPPAPKVPRKPARHYVPYIGLGLAFVALHVWADAPYQPVACFGIAIVVWAYLQIGSVNEIIPDRH